MKLLDSCRPKIPILVPLKLLSPSTPLLCFPSFTSLRQYSHPCPPQICSVPKLSKKVISSSKEPVGDRRCNAE